jgi:hypothetical protein
MVIGHLTPYQPSAELRDIHCASTEIGDLVHLIEIPPRAAGSSTGLAFSYASPDGGERSIRFANLSPLTQYQIALLRWSAEHREAMTITRLTAPRAIRAMRVIGNRSNRSSGNSKARAPKFSLNRPA